MDLHDSSSYLMAVLISNLIALVILFFCWKHPRMGRLLLFLLFGWAGCINWYTATHTPQDYLNYADLAFLPVYRSFINGWFSRHIVLMVGFIATGQLLVAAAMWLKGWLFKLGTIGGMLFLAGIVPLGIGSGFPFPIIAAFAFYLLYKHPATDYLWKREPATVLLRQTQQ